jgi:hypothetical protein
LPVTYSDRSGLAAVSTPSRRTLILAPPAWNAASCSNSGASAFSRSKSGNENIPHRSWGPPWTQQLSPSPMRYRLAGSATGRERSITAWISVKIAVVPPMPSASVSTAAAVNTGDSRNCRNA